MIKEQMKHEEERKRADEQRESQEKADCEFARRKEGKEEEKNLDRSSEQQSVRQ